MISSDDIDSSGIVTLEPIALTTPNIVGTVYGPLGSAHATSTLENISVEIFKKSEWEEQKIADDNTDSNGNFKMSVTDSGTYTLKIWAYGYEGMYAGSEYTIVIGSDGSVESVLDSSKNPASLDELRLSDPSTSGLKVIVYDPDNNPLEGASLGLRKKGLWEGGMSQWINTASNGTGIFGNVDDDTVYELEVSPPWDKDYSKATLSVVITDTPDKYSDVDKTTTTDERTITVKLKEPNIYGYVYTPEFAAGHTSSTNPTPNQPVDNAWVEMHTKWTEGMGMEEQRWYNANTNEEGKFSFGGVKEGTYMLEVQAPWGSTYSAPSPIEITISKEVADGTATLVIGQGGEVDPSNATSTPVRLNISQLIGTVVDWTDTPVRDSWVMVHNQNWTVNQGTSTDENGKFTIGGLEDGTYYLEIESPWGSETAMTPPKGLVVIIENGVGNIKIGDKTKVEGKLDNNKVIMQSPPNTISGYVYKDENNNGVYDEGEGVRYARIEAHGDGKNFGHFETKTDNSGHYELKISDGSWWLEVMRDWGQRNDWMYTGKPKRVTLPESDDTPTAAEENFKVSEMDANIVVTVKTPASGGQAAQPLSNVWVVAHREGPGSEGSTDANGRVTLPVAAGTYWVEVFPPMGGGGEGISYGPPDPVTVTVKSGETVSAGTDGVIYLKARQATIKGAVVDGSGNPQQNVMIEAWQMGKPGWAHTFTGADGTYELKVVGDSNWMVMVMPMSFDLIYKGEPQKVEIGEKETKTDVDFTLYRANASVSGSIFEDANKNGVMDSGEIVTDIWGGVWVKDMEEGEALDFGGMMEDMMEEGGMMEDEGPMGPGMEKGAMGGGHIVNGKYELKVPKGSYDFGLGMPPGSDYTFVGAATTTPITVNPDDNITVNLKVKKNDKYIKGQLWKDKDGDGEYDEGEEIDLRVMVNADLAKGGAWQWTETDSSGAYTLKVCEGDWYVDAFVDPFMSFGEQQYMVVSAAHEPVTVTKDNTDSNPAIKNFEVKELNSSISGTVYDPDGNVLPNTWVFVDFGDENTKEDFKGPGLMLGDMTDGNGRYTIKLPSGTYKIGASLPPWTTKKWIQPDFLTVTIGDGENINSDFSSTDYDFSFAESDATISGYLYIDANENNKYDSGEEVSGFVRAWSADGGTAFDATTNGSYSLDVKSNSIWYVTGLKKGTDNTFYKSNEVKVNVRAKETGEEKVNVEENLKLVNQNMTIPAEKSVTFDATKQKTIVLKDGTTLDIPAGSIAASGSVTITITPTPELKAQANAKPISYGYSFEAFDSNGRSISAFVSNITISIPYSTSTLATFGLEASDIVPQYWDSEKNAWKPFENVTIDTDNHLVIIKTDHFTDVGLLGDYSVEEGEEEEEGGEGEESSSSGSSGGSRHSHPPRDISFSINAGAEKTTTRNVTLNIEATNAQWMMIANEPEFLGRDWEDYATSKDWTLTAGNGTKTVYIKFMSSDYTLSDVVSDSIVLEEETVSLPCEEKDLVKIESDPAVWLILNGKRHVFPHSSVYHSWGYPRDYSTVKVISLSELNAYPEGDPVPFRDGSMFRGTTSSLHGKDASAVFFVSDGKLRPIKSSEVYQALFNDPDWKLVTWIPDSLLSKFEYPLGDMIESADIHPNGTLVKYPDEPAVYLVSDGKLKPFVSWDVFVANGYEDRPIITISKTEVYETSEMITKLADSLTYPLTIASQ